MGVAAVKAKPLPAKWSGLETVEMHYKGMAHAIRDLRSVDLDASESLSVHVESIEYAVIRGAYLLASLQTKALITILDSLPPNSKDPLDRHGYRKRRVYARDETTKLATALEAYLSQQNATRVGSSASVVVPSTPPRSATFLVMWFTESEAEEEQKIGDMTQAYTRRLDRVGPLGANILAYKFAIMSVGGPAIRKWIRTKIVQRLLGRIVGNLYASFTADSGPTVPPAKRAKK